MRHVVTALIVCIFPGPALAQRVIVVPEHGSGDKVVIIGELPAETRAVLRQAIKCEPKVAFLYWHCYIFGDGFDLWTSNGRFVLFDTDQYWESPRETLAQMLGPNGETMLVVPWSYRIPAGLATILVIIAVTSVLVYRSATARANRLLTDNKYQEALQVYGAALPVDGEPTAEDKQKAFAAGMELLLNNGVQAETAQPALRLLVQEFERDQSYDLRNQAVAHEQAGEWEQAIELYTNAARLREDADRKDYDFLLKCIERVRGKQARSG